MPTDYSKKKNAELADLLKSRSLPHTGKKDELIARLQESDAKATATAPSKPETAKPTTTTTATAEDEIDWDDETPTTSVPNPPAAAALAAGGKGQIANPTAVPNQVPAIDPAKTDDLTVETAPAPPTTTTTTTASTEEASPSKPDNETKADAETKPPVDFTSHLPTTTLDAELAKRQARAARFGLTATTTSSSDNKDKDAQKALERAKKFGTISDDTNAVVKGLDEALPERKKRGRGERDEGEGRRGGSKVRRQQGGGGGGGRDGDGRGKRDGRRGGEGERAKSGNQAAAAAASPAKANGASEKDRVAAEARKKRFAAAA